MSKIHHHAEKYIWLWSGVGVVMATLLGLWIYTLPQRINFDKNNSAKDLLWDQQGQELNKMLQDNSVAVEKIQQFAKLYKDALTTIVSGSATSSEKKTSEIFLTPEQLQKIKQQLEIK